MLLACHLKDSLQTHGPQSWRLKKQGVSSQSRILLSTKVAFQMVGMPTLWHHSPPPLGGHLPGLLPACPAKEALSCPSVHPLDLRHSRNVFVHLPAQHQPHVLDQYMFIESCLPYAHTYQRNSTLSKCIFSSSLSCS